MAYLNAGITALMFMYLAWRFSRWIRQSRALTDEEHGKVPIESFRCGGRLGVMNYTYPFMRLALYEDFLVLSLAGQAVVLHYWEITKLRRTFSGFEIQHRSDKADNYLEVFTWRRAHAMEMIERLRRQALAG